LSNLSLFSRTFLYILNSGLQSMHRLTPANVGDTSILRLQSRQSATKGRWISSYRSWVTCKNFKYSGVHELYSNG
jgi:hypothetical protein